MALHAKEMALRAKRGVHFCCRFSNPLPVWHGTDLAAQLHTQSNPTHHQGACCKLACIVYLCCCINLQQAVKYMIGLVG
jgi:hypothetical protein